MLLNTFIAVLAIVTLQSGTPAAQPDAATPRDRILALARAGRHQDAWKAWDALARTPEHLRLGITLAGATRQLTRGVDLYQALETETHKPDREALTEIALQAAEEVSASPDVEAKVNACGAALLLAKSHAPCRRVLETIAQDRDVDDQALAVYAMANAGVRQPGDRVGSLAVTMSRPLRLQLARRMTHMSSAERVALLRPLLNDPDMPTRYEAVLIATEIPGPEVVAALGNVQGGPFSGPLDTAVMLALARHGDASKLPAITQALPRFTGVNKVTAARVLAAAKDRRGIDMLNDMLRSPQEADRLQAAEAMADINPDAARPVLLQAVGTGGQAIRQSALIAAGTLELGTNAAIYRKLLDPAPPIRAAAVEAIANTFYRQDHRAAQPRVR